MKRFLVCAAGLWMAAGLLMHNPALAHTVVFEESNFPTLDSAPISTGLLHRTFGKAEFASADRLAAALADPKATVLVLPYGSGFPRERWSDIRKYLLRGGNLVTLGGRPFTRPLVRTGGKWQLLPETYAYARQLLISDYQTTAGSDATVTETDGAERYGLTALRWQRAYSMTIRLSQKETAKRVGASGTFDAALNPLVWGVSHDHVQSAPVVELDHLENDYAGGRWVMLNCSLDPAFLAGRDAAPLLEKLVARAALGAEQVRAVPSYPLYLPGEDWRIQFEWKNLQQQRKLSRIEAAVFQDGRREAERGIALPSPSAAVSTTIPLLGSHKPGYHTVEIRLICGDQACGTVHTAFWVRDRTWLASGPKVSVDGNFFRIDGQREAVVGTTYMASDAQRLYFRYPNPYVWDRDMAQISAGGLNMLRTGIWTDWDQVADADGTVKDRALRTVEAYLMTARKYGLPVQFTLFAFMPEVFGGSNPYIDPEGLRRQHKYVATMARSFGDVPFLMWDLINEPSFDNPAHFFTTMPNGDGAESAAWNAWLMHRYGSREAVAQAWHFALPDNGPIPVPGEADATAQSANDDAHPLAVTDFALFAQESFSDWARTMRAVIRETGSRQLITVGQDEGGALISPSPNYFKEAVDFTTVHSWWFNDDLLWDSLSAKQQGMPMLVQETGIMPEVNADARPRRTPDEEAALLERKIGTALATGSGAIEWLWNVNALMRSQQEVTIGALRPDGTEKLDAAVLRAYAAFAKAISPRLGNPAPEQAAILTSQAAQFSVLQTVASDAQHRAVRAMNYLCRTPARLVGENRVADITGTKLVVLPSALMLRQETWDALLQYVAGGGTLLITGSAERDEHWLARDRLKALGLDAVPAALTYRSIDLDIGGRSQTATFSNLSQRGLEALRLPGGQSFAELRHGKGRILVVAAPVELAESPDVTVAVYRDALQRAGVVSSFDVVDVPGSVLVRPVHFPDATLYLFASEDASVRTIVVRDSVSGAVLRRQLLAGHAQMLLIDRKSGAIVASYGGDK
jgi:hypothetical protein